LSRNYGSLNFLETEGPVHTCNGTDGFKNYIIVGMLLLIIIIIIIIIIHN